MRNSKVLPLPASLKRLGRSVGRRNRKSIARQAVMDDRICNKLLHYLGRKLAKEMKCMCSMKTNSVLRAKDPTSLQKFNFKALIEEMRSVAPKTLSLLRSCIANRKRSRATNVKTKGRTKSRVFDCDNVVGVCCALLLRGRSQRMNLLQRLVSCVLYSGHSSKKV